MWKSAVILALCLTPVAMLGQQQTPARERQREAQQPPPPATITTNESSSHYEQKSGAKPQGWHKFVTWPEGIIAWAVIFTLGAIVWQAIETRRAARASERAVIASLRPQLKVPAIALIPGKLVEVDGRQTIQDDVNWQIECLIANAGGSKASVIESNLTISKLGIGAVPELLPVFPPYGAAFDSFGNFTVQSGERRRQTIVLDPNTDTMKFRMLRSQQERKGHTAVKVICFGFLHYRDDAGVGRRTGFAFVYDPEEMSFTRIDHPNYDYAD